MHVSEHAAVLRPSRYHRRMKDPAIVQAVKGALAKQPALELAFVFGSVATGTHREDSDVDVAVQFKQVLDASQRIALVGDLALATGRAIDLIDLRTAGEPLLGQILAHGQRLLGSDDAHASLLSRHLIDAADFLPIAQRIVDHRRRAWIGQ